MRRHVLVNGLLLGTLLAASGCGRLPGKPAPGAEVPRPDSILDPVVLYRTNCAGCHGSDGKLGPAMMLSDPVYLSIVDNDTLRSTIAHGRAGTAMSAFSQQEGGMLTDEQIESIVRGIRERWGASPLVGATPPPYTAITTGNAAQGERVYATFCASCHGNDGSGNTEMGRGLSPRAPDMRLPATQNLSDAELFYIIENGVWLTGMPAWGTGTKEGEAQSWHLVQFIRHLPQLTPAEIEEMEALNPRSPNEVRQEIEQEQFLQGGDVTPH